MGKIKKKYAFWGVFYSETPPKKNISYHVYFEGNQIDIAYGKDIPNREALRLVLRLYISSAIVGFVELPQQSAWQNIIGLFKKYKSFQL